MTKLTPAQIRSIFLDPRSVTATARHARVSNKTVSAIRHGKARYGRIVAGLEPPLRTHGNSTLDLDRVRAIYVARGLPGAIAARFRVPREVVYKIRAGETHAEITCDLRPVPAPKPTKSQPGENSLVHASAVLTVVKSRDGRITFNASGSADDLRAMIDAARAQLA